MYCIRERKRSHKKLKTLVLFRINAGKIFTVCRNRHIYDTKLEVNKMNIPKWTICRCTRVRKKKRKVKQRERKMDRARKNGDQLSESNGTNRQILRLQFLTKWECPRALFYLLLCAVNVSLVGVTIVDIAEAIFIITLNRKCKFIV